MTRHVLMMIPLYLLMISAIYGTHKSFKSQEIWNTIKTWSAIGCIVSIIGLFVFIYQDFFNE